MSIHARSRLGAGQHPDGPINGRRPPAGDRTRTMRSDDLSFRPSYALHIEGVSAHLRSKPHLPLGRFRGELRLRCDV